MFIFCARLHEVASYHNAGIGMGVIDQLRYHCLLLFYVFRLSNKVNLLFAVIFFYLIASISYVTEFE